MGIEGERLVLDYLSRVGDLAHGTGMSAMERSALVVRLREEIGQQRSPDGQESRREVNRILGRIGRPEDVVAAASGGTGAVPAARATLSAQVPVEAAQEAPAATARPATDGYGGLPAVEEDSAEELAAADEPAARPIPLEWQDGRIGAFVGGIEIPEMLRPPSEGERATAEDERAAPKEPVLAGVAVPGAAAQAKETPARVRGLRRAREALRARAGGPFELLGVLLLVAGAVTGSLIVLGLGWLTAYWSPRLSRREAKWATFGMPGLVGGGYLIWLFGRVNAYWGEPVEQGTMGGIIKDHLWLLLCAAAVASAAFLFYRARRPAR